MFYAFLVNFGHSYFYFRKLPQAAQGIISMSRLLEGLVMACVCLVCREFKRSSFWKGLFEGLRVTSKLFQQVFLWGLSFACIVLRRRLELKTAGQKRLHAGWKGHPIIVLLKNLLG